ncbi:hypothetical protein B1T34_14195 [Staphylococcus aureus]|nr:hypothetical protein B1T33_13770 [Staphylococcus aureus]PTY47840.1 hypothetical protein B1T34_14195 [Staphylococcus aureus]
MRIQFHYVGPVSPTCIVCRNWKSDFTMLGSFPQLALSVEIEDPISLCWGPANLHVIES